MHFELKDLKAFQYLEIISNTVVCVLSYFLLYPLDKMKAIHLHNFPLTQFHQFNQNETYGTIMVLASSDFLTDNPHTIR